MAATYLLSTALMGVLVLGIAFVVARGRAWHEYRPQFVRPEDFSVDGDPLLLMLGFILLIVVTLGTTLFAVGVYVTARSNGHPHSHAVGEAIITLGALVLATVVGWLLLTAGA